MTFPLEVRCLARHCCVTVLCGLLLAACPSWDRNLPDQDKELWNECWQAIARANGCLRGYCGRRYDEGCMREKANPESFAAQPNSRARARWAVDHGCPEAVADPEGFAEHQRARVTIERDRSAGLYRYAMKPNLARAPRGQLSLMVEMASPNPIPARADFGFVASSPTQQHLDCRDLHVVADGVRLDSREVARKKVVLRGAGVEFIYVSLSRAELKTVADADSVEYKLCNTVGRLAPEERWFLRELIRLTPSPTSSPSARD